jgi:hypothetical protein
MEDFFDNEDWSYEEDEDENMVILYYFYLLSYDFINVRGILYYRKRFFILIRPQKESNISSFSFF